MTPDEFDACFDRFHQTVFRLETLDHYDVDGERLAEFHRGAPLPVHSVRDTPWLRRLASTSLAGKRWSRVHLITMPLSAYLEYELAAYTTTAACGENIAIAVRGSNRNLDQAASSTGDFWLFDEGRADAYAVAMTYDTQGHPGVHRLVTDRETLDTYRAVAELSRSASTSLNEFRTYLYESTYRTAKTA